MANLTRSHAIINWSFKSLSIFATIVAATRLALQYNAHADRIQYVTLVFLLVVETAVAIIMASISSYRAVVLDQLAGRSGKAIVPLQSKTDPIRGAGPGHREPDELCLRQNSSFATLLFSEPSPT